MFDNEIDAAITLLREQWDIAERRIKKAEFVNANNIISSAIFELRYAGRKLVDANRLILEGAWRTSQEEKNKILAYLADATEDCVKAKHDAIDAMMLFIAAWLERTERKLGLSEIQKYFPSYTEITGKMITIQDKISASRGDRTVLRDSIYEDIESSGYDEILSLYQKMKVSEPRVRAEIRVENRRRFVLIWGTVASLAIGLAALALAGVPYVERQPAQNQPMLSPTPSSSPAPSRG